MENVSKRLPSCCMLVRPSSWESNLHQQAVLLNCYSTHGQAKIEGAFFSAQQLLHSKGQAVLGPELPEEMSTKGDHTGIRTHPPQSNLLIQGCQYQPCSLAMLILTAAFQGAGSRCLPLTAQINALPRTWRLYQRLEPASTQPYTNTLLPNLPLLLLVSTDPPC